jgi:hypothetical protein
VIALELGLMCTTKVEGETRSFEIIQVEQKSVGNVV